MAVLTIEDLKKIQSGELEISEVLDAINDMEFFGDSAEESAATAPAKRLPAGHVPSPFYVPTSADIARAGDEASRKPNGRRKANGRPKGTTGIRKAISDPYKKMEKLVDSYHAAICDDSDDRKIDRLIAKMEEMQNEIERRDLRGIVLDQWQALNGAGSDNGKDQAGRDYAYSGQVGAMHAAMVADCCQDARWQWSGQDDDFPENRYVGKSERPINSWGPGFQTIQDRQWDSYLESMIGDDCDD